MSIVNKTLLTLLLLNLSANILQASPRLVRYTFTITNEGREFVKETNFYVAAPQEHLELKTNHSYKKTEDYVGNQLLSFKLTNIAPRGTKIITVSAKINSSEEKKQLGKSLKEFVLPQDKIESQAKEIVEKAKALKKSNDRETVKVIYKWVKEHLRFSHYEKKLKGALWAYKNTRGDCTEHACLTAALCRSLAIPAKVVSGFVMKKDGVLRAERAHDWAEVLINGKWRVVDSHGQKFMTDKDDYIAFRTLSASEASPLRGLRRYQINRQKLTAQMGCRMSARLAEALRPGKVRGRCASCK